MTPVLRFLRSPRVALTIIAFLAVWTGVGAWAPWMQPSAPPAPAWAHTVGLAHPFTSWPFLAGVALLFASTLACTWGRRSRILAIRRGELPPSSVRLPARDADVRAFLADEGFRGSGEILGRFTPALWGGWVLHVGLLVLIAAVLVQFSFSDSGTFDLTEGERVELTAHGAVFQREQGPLAPASLPDLAVALLRFDPFKHQHGYSQDRLSDLEIDVPGGARLTETIDRAAGVRVENVEIFQAIPTGMSLVLDIQGMGPRAVRLQGETPRRASAEVKDTAGMPVRFVLETEQSFDDPAGTGRMLLWLDGQGSRRALAPGVPFRFGTGQARVTSVTRWGRFTYTRTPGLWGVVAGFGLVLAGCLLLAFPAGVARIETAGDGPVAVVFTVRGGSAIAAEWNRAGPTAPGA